MPILVQLCVVAVTAGIVGVCIATIRAIRRLERAADRISDTADSIQGALTDWRAVTDEAHELVMSISTAVPRLNRVAADIEGIGGRVSRMAHLVLDEVSVPVGVAAGVLRTVRRSGNMLLTRVLSGRHASAHNGGGFQHERDESAQRQ